jgi:hypothetical protein
MSSIDKAINGPLVATSAIAFVLLLAAAGKALSVRRNAHVDRRRATGILAVAETFVAVLLLVGGNFALPCALALAMTAAFLFVTTLGRLNGRPSGCDCFGAFAGRPKAGGPLAADALLVALALYATVASRSDMPHLSPTLPFHWQAASGLAVAAAVLVMHGAAIPRIRTVPDLSVDGGGARSLVDLVDSDSTVFVAFTRAGCPECDRVIRALSTERVDRPRALILNLRTEHTGPAASAAVMPIHVDESEAAAAFRLRKVPSGVWIRAGRWTRSALVEGASAVIALSERSPDPSEAEQPGPPTLAATRSLVPWRST